MQTIKRGDWVLCRNDVPGRPVGIVRRVARDGSWADVDWRTHRKRMRTSALVVQHTIQRGAWEITDLTRQRELEQAAHHDRD